ncbi:hypothetical protein JCM6882_004973 [Rhodosporidiobolus microsporus]
MTTIDALPTELLAYILSLIDPPTSTLTIPPRSSLYRCCLVSRRMRDCAQPLLWRALHSKNLDALAREAGADGPGRHARFFELDGRGCFEQHGRVRRLLQLPGLEDLRISGWIMGARHQDLLNLLAPLRRLVLHDVRTVDSLNPVVFPNLQALTLRDCYLPPSFFGPSSNRTTFRASSTSALRQLESLHVDISDLQFMDSGPESHEVHVLVSASIQDLSGMGLANLADFLPSSSLSAILLPADMKDPLFAEQHDAILKACDEKGIKVLWEMEALDDKRGLWMRDEFHRGVVRKKREGGQAR